MAVDGFRPEIWSAEILTALRNDLVYASLCNTDYEGEITDYGDTVHVTSIGEVATRDYTELTSISWDEVADSQVDLLIDQKLADMRSTITDEKAHLLAYNRTLDSYRGETNEVGGGVAASSFRAMAERFYQIVVRADVGIIDVAWALKQNKTDENSRLVREKKRDLKVLDDEFREVLKE